MRGAPLFSSHPAALAPARPPPSAQPRPDGGKPRGADEAAARSWLAARGLSEECSARCIAAFRSAGFPSADWLRELEAMAAEDALAAFVAAAERSLPAESTEPGPPAGGKRKRRRLFGLDLTNSRRAPARP